MRHRYPAKEWEVINLGASAINSNVVRKLRRSCSRSSRDLVLIYMGHNEYYGPDGVGASYPEKLLPVLTPLKYRARHLRLVQKLQTWFAPSRVGEKAPANLMQQVSGGQRIELRSDES